MIAGTLQGTRRASISTKGGCSTATNSRSTKTSARCVCAVPENDARRRLWAACSASEGPLAGAVAVRAEVLKDDAATQRHEGYDTITPKRVLQSNLRLLYGNHQEISELRNFR